MLTLFGDSPHSPYQLARLLAKLNAAQPTKAISGLHSQSIYFVDTQGTLPHLEQESLALLLSASMAQPFKSIESRRLDSDQSYCNLFIIPRLGTISPWSSKATCIAEACGLKNIRRIEQGVIYHLNMDNPDRTALHSLSDCLYDRMTESVLFNLADAAALFEQANPRTFTEIPVLEQGLPVLKQANTALGLALSLDEMQYLFENFQALKRNPTDLELMMFAQANSEHCRHKIFNALWVIDGITQDSSLFDMIRHTYRSNPKGVISAYRDNGAVLEGALAPRWLRNPHTYIYEEILEPCHLVIKVETHNHPTGIAPNPGAATGAGGEIRDEGAVGRGAKPKAGLVGFTVSNLCIPDFIQPWESAMRKAAPHMANALTIMLEGPIGAASFNNEFGRPSICGYFRSYEQGQYGYHKPIMIAGGLGNVRAQASSKGIIPEGAKVIVLGGPAMLIGLGGGAASSMVAGSSDQALDFASVQRSNPQLQRCCQEVIDACWALGDKNPIIAIHDVGAGGLANALPELVHDSNRGAHFDLRAIPNAELGMSPLEIWCNEAQERYVLAVSPSQLEEFEQIARRERCPYAIVGKVNATQTLLLTDPYFNNKPAELPLAVLLGKMPQLVKTAHAHLGTSQQDCSNILPVCSMTPRKASEQVRQNFIESAPFGSDLSEAAERVLQLPCVADKSFLITIGDRSVGGLVSRDQMVGPWQVPVSDVAVTLNSFSEYGGEAMAMGERSPMALIDPAASACLAVGEAITNIAAAYIGDISAIKLSANWMAGEVESDSLYRAVRAVAMEFCPALGICIPVGKDSLSMQTVWKEEGETRTVLSPVSLIVSAFAPVLDARKTLTPLLNTQKETELLFIDISSMDLSQSEQALSASALAQVYQLSGGQPPNPMNPQRLKAFFQAIQALQASELLLAYHDRSDGGLFITLCEMAFASHVGLDITLDTFFAKDTQLTLHHYLACLFNEGLGAVIQIQTSDKAAVQAVLKDHKILEFCHVIGRLNANDRLSFFYRGKEILTEQRITWQRLWSATGYHMQRLRDNADCAEQAYDRLLDAQDPGLYALPCFALKEDIAAPYIHKGIRPKVAILREQGVNGHIEMSAAFAKAGFTSVDVHMSDIREGRTSLHNFIGLAICGGFSYGDVLGSGQGWAKSILFNAQMSDQFATFFERPHTFTLGVCNGCQMLSHLTEIIPGTAHWPRFYRNRSEQFEARLVMVRVEPSPSLFFKGMEGSQLPIVVSHGEGRVVFKGQNLEDLVALRFIDGKGNPTEHYPENPNGSPEGITGLTTTDGRVTIIMPHPERVFRTVQCSWHPSDWPEDSPWMRMFRNARVWVS